MNILARYRKLDRWIIEDFLEPKCHRFQRLTGRDNFWISGKLYLLIGIVLVHAVATMALHRNIVFPSPIAETFSDNPRWNIWMLYICCLGCFGRATFGRADNPFAVTVTTKNWTKAYDGSIAIRFMYLSTTTFAILGFVAAIIRMRHIYEDSAIFALNFAICLCYFLDACDPLPPCEGRIKKWLRVAIMIPAEKQFSAR